MSSHAHLATKRLTPTGQLRPRQPLSPTRASRRNHNGRGPRSVYSKLAEISSPPILGYGDPRRLLIIDVPAIYDKGAIHCACQLSHDVTRRPIGRHIRNDHAAVVLYGAYDRNAVNRRLLGHLKIVASQKSAYISLQFVRILVPRCHYLPSEGQRDQQNEQPVKRGRRSHVAHPAGKSRMSARE